MISAMVHWPPVELPVLIPGAIVVVTQIAGVEGS